MRSAVLDTLPLSVRRGLKKLGSDLSLARRKRRLTIAMMAERTSVSTATYKKIEKGDPSVKVGAYAMTLFVLGFGERLSELIDESRDPTGLSIDRERVPRRIRIRKGGAT
jgi:hypothetical protein